MTSIYLLKHEHEDPRFHEFDFCEDSPSLVGGEYLFKDFAGKDRAKLSWQPYQLREVWTPQPVIGDVPAFSDYPCVSMIPAFSQRAVTALRDLLEPNGELLPLDTDVGNFFVFNILSKSEAFDRDRAIAKFVPESAKETAFSIDRYEFHEDLIGKHDIFRIREYPPGVYVSEEFRNRAQAAYLNGMNFIKVWPLESDETWDDIQRKQERQRRAEVAALKGDQLIVNLPVDGEGTEDDETRGFEIANAISAELVSHQKPPDSRFVGSIDSLQPGENALQIHIVCPDVKETTELLRPILESADWPQPLLLEKCIASPRSKKSKIETERLG